MSFSKYFVCFEALESRRLLSAGSLDTSFGVGGVVVEAASVTPNDMVVQADGKILISDPTEVLRFNADGSPDTSFGIDGVVTPGFTVAGVAVQSDGKIVVGGSTTAGWAVARYNANGTLDTTFGSDTGKVITQTNGYTSMPDAVGVVIEGNGNIIVGGDQNIPDSPYPDNSNYAAICFNADGSVNTAFGANGEAISGETGVSAQYAVAISEAPDGDVLIGGQYTDFGNTRNATAILFSPTGGIVSTPITPTGFFSDFNGQTIRPDGTLVIATRFIGEAPVVQFNMTRTSCAFDPFSNQTLQSLVGVANASNNQVVVIGTGPRGGGLTRFNSDGSIDDTFGLDGSVNFTAQDLGIPGRFTIYNIAVVPDGDILVDGVEHHRLFLASFQGGSNALDQEKPIAYCDPSQIKRIGHNRYEFSAQFVARQSIDTDTIGDNNIVVIGPRGVHERATLVSVTASGNTATAVYTIHIDKLGIRHPTAMLNINLRPNQVFDNFGNMVAPGLLAQFQAVLN